ncbi:MAG: hypothetical protein J2P43_12470 [Candidatus Dormibacteraeota bacterium]|nr:hypothetical protein [Candidatus Dormibacteraeota bacterium]MBO0745828.1 hypothetical protein [Candidatus Dormibacteraeota bacterium]
MPDPARRRGRANLVPQAPIPWAGDWPDVSPVTIVRLERWVAFPLRPQELPPAHLEAGILDAYPGPYGTGDSPDAAYLDLARHLFQERDRRR